MLQLEIRGLQKGAGKLDGVQLRGGKKNPSVNQPGKDGIQVEGEFVTRRNGTADLVEAQVMVQALQKEISAVVGGLSALVNEFRWRLSEDHRPAILFFFFIQFLDVLAGPFVGILSIQFFPEFRFGA